MNRAQEQSHAPDFTLSRQAVLPAGKGPRAPGSGLYASLGPTRVQILALECTSYVTLELLSTARICTRFL